MLSSPCPPAIATTPPSHQPPPVTHMSSPMPSPSQLLGASFPSNKGPYGGPMPGNAIIGSDSASILPHNIQLATGKVPQNGQRLDSVAQPGRSKSLKISQRARKAKETEVELPLTFKKPPILDIDEDFVRESEPAEAIAPPAPKAAASDALPPKKCRRKKGQTGETGQTKIKKPRITKRDIIKDVTKTKKLVPPKKSRKDRSPERLLSDAVAKRKAVFAPEQLADLGLKEGTRRKTDWTPVKDSTAPTSGEALESTGALLSETPIITSPTARFGKLLNEYGFTQQREGVAVDVTVIRANSDFGNVKKRKIELVNIASNSVVPGKAKTAKSTKKIQTITAKATEGFMVQGEGTTQALIENCMPPPDTEAVVRTKKGQPAKSTKSKAKKKKSVEAASIVQSPETAIKATRNQDFVFGTSSQLVREDSPTFIDDHHRSIKQPESVTEFSMQSVPPLPLSLQTSSSIALMPSRNLWSEAARNDGSVLEAEYVNLANTTQPVQTHDESTAREKTFKPSIALPTKTHNMCHYNEEPSSPSKTAEHDSQSKIEQRIVETTQSPPRSVTKKPLKSPSPKKKVSTAKAAPDQMPNYQGFTDVELRKTIKSYGFKRIAKREAMLLLLEKCWENKAGQVLQELPSNALIQQPSEDVSAGGGNESKDQTTAKSKIPKKRGRPLKAANADDTGDGTVNALSKKKSKRPKKGTSESTAAVEHKRNAKIKDKTEITDLDEIYDSTPPTPSPPRRRIPSKTAKALILSPSGNHRPASEMARRSPVARKDISEDRARLFAAITRAVTSQAPTHDIENPTWHERILMYEPIVIEDLATWLNHEGLAKVNEDDEVWTMLVKEWCESRSICCLWKENLRGLPRARW